MATPDPEERRMAFLLRQPCCIPLPKDRARLSAGQRALVDDAIDLQKRELITLEWDSLSATVLQLRTMITQEGAQIAAAHRSAQRWTGR